MEPLFISDRHALYVGWVAGIASKHGLDVSLVVNDEGTGYTNRITVRTPKGVAITVVVPPPPEEWTVHDDE